MSSRKGKTWRRRESKHRVIKTNYEIYTKLFMLFKWAKKNQFNLKSSILVPRHFDETGRGMACKRAVKVGDVIIQVPKHLLVTSHSIMEGIVGDVIKGFRISGLSPTNVLCSFLLLESFKGLDSDWFDYLNSLPRDYTTPCYWSREEINQLPVWIKQSALKQCREVRQSYDACKELLNNLCDIISQLSPMLITYEAYRWAWCTLNTRAVYMKQTRHVLLNSSDDNMALAPVLDLLNHSPDAQVKAGYNSDTGCYEIVTQQPYRKHEQVFINYGIHDNIKLLVEYGFIIPGNPHNIVPFDCGDVEKSLFDVDISHKEEKNLLLSEQNLLHNLYCSLEGISWNLTVVISLLMLEVHQLHLWKCCLVGGTISTNHLTACKRHMRKLLQSKLEQCVSCADLLLLQDTEEDGVNSQRRMIREIVTEQQEILRHCIGTVT